MDYLIHLVILISIFSILAISLDLVVGYTGLLSVTHAAFFGIGSYATAILLTRYGVHFFVSIVAGIIVAAVVSYLIGLVLSKFNDDYYALASLGFGVIVYTIFLNWQQLTRGPLGIPGISRPELFGIPFKDNVAFMALALLMAALVYAVARYLVRSPFGRVLKAIRDDEQAIAVFGYHTSRFKLVIFVISAAMAAIAGSLFASYITFISPSSFLLMESIFMLAMIILGGLSNIRGALLGAALLILLPEALRFAGFPSIVAGQMRQFVYGVLLVVLMLYRPQGIVGEYKL